MEESEIDEWFSEEKEKLEEKFYAALNANKGTEKAKIHFEKKYRALIASLQKKQLDLYMHKQQMAAMRAPLTRANARMQIISAKTKHWFAARKQEIKKWFFDQKVKRILRDKSDS